MATYFRVAGTWGQAVFNFHSFFARLFCTFMSCVFSGASFCQFAKVASREDLAA